MEKLTKEQLKQYKAFQNRLIRYKSIKPIRKRYNSANVSITISLTKNYIATFIVDLKNNFYTYYSNKYNTLDKLSTEVKELRNSLTTQNLSESKIERICSWILKKINEISRVA